eukprot:scaffold54306_cov38-Attheya_sp.AAC.4
MEYKWFPQLKNGKKRGRLTSQSPKWKGSEFDLFYFLNVNDGAMLFDMREDLEEGTQLLLSHFTRFSLEMNIRVGDKNLSRNASTFQWQTNNNQQISKTSKLSKVSSLSQTASNI